MKYLDLKIFVINWNLKSCLDHSIFLPFKKSKEGKLIIV